MGLPIAKILISSNQNNILTDWITAGAYDLTTRDLVQTISPAMDILKSSNVERILFDKFGYERTKELMDDLASSGKYKLTSDELEVLREDFDASFSTDEECEDVIGDYAKKGYIMDPHTATCMKAYQTLRKQKLATIVYSTAEWTKFSPTVARALGHEVKNDIEALDWIKDNIHLKVPKMVTELFGKPLIHDKIIDKNAIKESIFSIL